MSPAHRHDVAIYLPESATLYERNPEPAGGAELQSKILASELAKRGFRVAHIVYPLVDPDPPTDPPVTLVERAAYAGRLEDPMLGRGREVARVWRALNAADAGAYVVRMATPALAAIGAFCRMRRRKLVFMAASVLDFTFDPTGSQLGAFADSPWEARAYRFGVRLADAVLVENTEEMRLAREALPHLRRLEQMPSFTPVTDPQGIEPVAFLWLGRALERKDPLAYVRLAAAIPEARFRMLAVDFDDGDPLTARTLAEAREVPNLEVIEGVPHSEAMNLMSEAVAAVNTSPLEGVPNVFMEAWMRGIPVLSLRFDPDSIIERRGLGMAAGDSFERFVAGARALWDTRNDRADLTERVRAHALATYSPRVVGDRWAELLAGLGVGPEA